MEDSVGVLKFAECRAREISSLAEEITCKESKLTLQRLPYYMRRRASSHNPKRVPRKLREHCKGNLAKPTKKKSKKHRGKPKSLLEEYNRRQSNFLWLETHLWHAKRFHMEKKWGYTLPVCSTEKSFKASYKAAAKHTLLFDLSYYCCIELRGPEKQLLTELASLTDTCTGSTFESYLDGTKEGFCVLYHPKSYPFQAIGPVSFIWETNISSNVVQVDSELSDFCRKLWIWCHPTIHSEIVEVLVNVFQLEKVEAYDFYHKSTVQSVEECNEDVEMSEENRDFSFASQVNYDKIKLKYKKEQFYMSNTFNKIKMVLLKDTLVRYRLIGPMAQSVIINMLKVADVSMTSPCRNAESNETDSSCEMISSSKNSDECLFWWQTYYNSKNMQSLHMKKKCLMEKLKNQITYVIPPRTVMGLTVRDPRILSPQKFDSSRSSEAITNYCIQELDELFTPDIASSAVWDEDIRHEVTATQISENDLNKEKEKYIVPNATFNLGEKESRIPIIMIQQPGRNGFGFGWDIIVPQGWGMAFWMSLIHNRARAAGLRDMCTINIESGQPSFPDSFPDSKSGSLFEEEIRKKCLIEFYKLPKSKRPSFNKLGINTPFFLPYVTLVNDWEEEYIQKNASLKDSLLIQDNQKEVFVVRNRKLIGYLKNVCVNCNAKKKMKNLMDNFNIIVDFTLNPEHCLTRSLITVRVKCVYRGVPSKNSGIYLCDDLDISLLKENQKYCGPVEPNCSSNASKSENIEVHPNRQQTSSKNKKKKLDLERPEVNSVIFSCSRHKIGYISEGGFSNLSSNGCGIGHCSLIGFLSVLESCLVAELRPTVLIREQHSFQYRTAFVDVL